VTTDGIPSFPFSKAEDIDLEQKGNLEYKPRRKTAISGIPSTESGKDRQKARGANPLFQLYPFLVPSHQAHSQLPMSSESLTLRGRRATSIIPIVTRETEPK
jgi:hypothetical protein